MGLHGSNGSDISLWELPPSVDLRITGECNLRCPFCFGPRHEVGLVDMSRLIGIVPQLKRFGVRNVVITGGEPLLVGQPLVRLLEALKAVGITAVLSTNGLLLVSQLNAVAPYLDWISLPLDADTPNVSRAMRYGDARSFSTTLDLIPRVRREYPSLRIKLGTVVCRINKDHILGIPGLVQGDRKPDIWKLYQVSYSSYGLDNRALIDLTDVEFERIAKSAGHEAVAASLPITFYRNRDRSGSYLFFEPTGDAMAIVGEQEVVIGNFLEDFDGVLQKWRAFVNPDRLWRHVLHTYSGGHNA